MSEAFESPAASRRTVLCGAAAVLAAGGAVAVTGCASSGSGSSSSGSGSAGSAKGGLKDPVVVGPAADIPVGGGKVFREQKVVVTQPSPGTYEAFSAVCTHAGCVVDKVENQLIKCPCHGSTFNATTGARVEGPAPTGLPQYQAEVQGTDIKVSPRSSS
ncbi:Rieske (2Fe-2S) protein [Kitasatospora sp. NPDC048239]|uniref:Rieske (2Fe-2S) protein n=1 Tax=Kitasatospora sp. NPDC048239 TaxID=3364046 RepID=UPI00371C2D23